MPHVRLSNTAAFWLITVTTAAVLFCSAAPSPIYPVYQKLWGFSSFTLTVVFAVYVIALLGSLLTVGSISDYVGRRPVIMSALLALIASMFIFIVADGVGLLVVARVVQGLATGALLGTLSAAIFDLQPSERSGATASGVGPGIGLALGVAITGVLVEYAPAPRVLIFAVTITIFVVLLLFTIALPETSAVTGFKSRRHILATISPRISVPRSVRAVFLASMPAIIATWSLAGLQLSLGSAVVENILNVHNRAAASLMLATFFSSAAIASFALAHTKPTTKLTVGYVGLLLGVFLSLPAYIEGSVPGYLLGVVVAGIGFGTLFSGVMGKIGAVTAPEDGSRVFSSLFIVSYIGFSLPALIAGLATVRFGLLSTAIGYAAIVILLTLVAIAAQLTVARRPSTGVAPTPNDVVTPH
ncbi:MFS transporter [Rhodococcus sp. 06-156-3C]|uniref:MFS transporter n=1 Tax=Nocardiaceae TaxID=85025 RepID=UPI000522E8CC|nr:MULTISPECIES: MFS transporter [Rhodococcus]OZD18246.1 MFS transporter [Rhodococcus sp. 06-156-4C]OZD18844.1 MFS transporter [Rhodococcus sp. 06-156-3C]OZD22354.1 MFS transporter [Rhodococcus sp. 06-156-4a]OZD33938.1 MFS transporter [Rhodococcus sp. 06-156-3b]OZD38675.1 MFS transporter [Rhodococcus sp. 06-156-3]